MLEFWAQCLGCLQDRVQWVARQWFGPPPPPGRFGPLPLPAAAPPGYIVLHYPSGRYYAGPPASAPPAARARADCNVQDVSFDDLETLLARIKEVERELALRESNSGYCWHDVSRKAFGARCEGCEEHLRVLREEMRLLYREMSRLQQEESARVVRQKFRPKPVY